MTPPAAASIVTVLTARQPTGKRYSLRAGQLHKATAAAYAVGVAIGRPTDSAEAMAALLADVTARRDTVLIPGHFIGNDDDRPFEIVTAAALADQLDLPDPADVPGGIIEVDGHRVAARLKRSIEPSGWLLIDGDTPEGMPDDLAALDIGQRLVRLEAIVPGISRCERIEARSSSARIVPPGGQPGRASHAWIRVSDPEAVAALRLHVHVEAQLAGLAFASPRRSRTTGEIIGRSWLTLCDLSVWIAGRIVFCSAPQISEDMQAAGWTVADAGGRIVNPGKGPLDLEKIRPPRRRRLADYHRATGELLVISGKGSSLAITSSGVIDRDTPIDTEHAPVTTFGEALAYLQDQPEGTRLRCQTPFRASDSEAAFIRLTGPGLTGFLFDAGTNTTYRYVDAGGDAIIASEQSFLQAVVASEFVERHGEDFRYVAARSCWYWWNGRHWEPEKTELAFSLIARLFAARSFAVGHKLGASDVRGAEAIARSHRAVALVADKFNSHPWLLNHMGGTMDLRDGESRPWRREDYLTQCCTATPQGSCPLWLKFLAKITGGDADLQAYLARVVGYCLTGFTGEHVVFNFWGEGRNGKGTLLETVAAILGPYARSVASSLFTETRGEQHPTGLADLEGRRFVYTGEVASGRRWNTELIKELSGGDTVSARFMRQDFFTFAPVCKLVVSGNHKIGLRRVDTAIRERLQMVPFAVVIPRAERDPHLREKLLAERDGILAWAVKGCQDWRQGGLEPPACVREATAAYFDAQDAIGRWLDECCETGTGSAYSATAAELYNSWQRWCAENGEDVIAKRTFGSVLDERGFPAGKGTGGVRRRQGLRLTAEEIARLQKANAEKVERRAGGT